MSKYVIDEDGKELEGVIGFDEDGYIFDEVWLEEWFKKQNFEEETKWV